MSDAGLPSGAERELAAFLERWLGREAVPGISLAAFDADGLPHAAGLGARDVAACDPATPGTRYAVGSLAKPPTAIARPGYGYGIERTEFFGETLLEHPGSLLFSGGYLGCLPERGVGVALAYNGTGFSWMSVGRGALAIACGEDPVETVRMLVVTDAVDSVTGRYTSHNDAVSATVEEGPIGTIRIDPPGPSGTFTASPDEVSGPDSTFSAERGDGHRWTLPFGDADAGVELLLTGGNGATVLHRE